MVRKLALAVSLALGTISVPAHALGLGELSSKSTLNQNFSGEIALLSVNPDELGSVRVNLADADAFGRAGIDRPFYLSLLKFEPMLNSRNKPVVRVTSDFPIREPFLNFLIEVNWPRGRLMREYTVLLDPPTTTRRRAPVVTPAKAVAPPAAAAQPVAQPARPVAAPAQVATQTAMPGEYGPVKANDTAWGIASRLRPANTTIEQMMLALLEANPDAFIANDINRLRRGRILRVPSLEEIQRLSRAEARAAYREQQDRWMARRDAVKATKVAAESTESAEPSVAPAGSDDGDAAADQLRIATARPQGEGEAGAGDDNAAAPAATDIKARLIAARENAESSRQEAETLRSQVDELQERLQSMQRLLSLKDEQLAQLQDRVVSEGAAGADQPNATLPLPAAAEAPAMEGVPGDQVVVEGEAEKAATDAEGAALEQEMSGIAADAADRVNSVSKAVDDAVAELMANGDQTVEAQPGDASVAADVEGAAESAVVVADATAEQQLPAVLDLEIPQQIDPDRIVLGLDAPPPAEETVEVAQGETAQGEMTVGAGGGSEIVVEGGAAQEVQEPVVVVEPGVPDAAGPVADTAAAGAPSEPPAAEPPTVIPTPAAQPSLMDTIEKNIVPIAAGGVGLLALIGWLLTRRRKGDDDADDTVALAAAGTAAMAGAAASDQDLPVDEPILDASALEELPDSSFLDEFDPSDINALQDETGEVDPVSEADVYIAYGRYQQAEELLNQAMARDPDRLALKHKLLEVHYATRDVDAFGGLVQEMVDKGQDAVDADAWVRIRDMGRELAPNNPLYARDTDGESDWDGSSAVAATSDVVDPDTLSIADLELSELNAAYDEQSSSLSELDPPSEVSITLDMDSSSEFGMAPAAEAPQPATLDNLEPLDFEMPDAEKPHAGTEADDDVITDTLDLDSMMAEAEAAVDQGDSSLGLDSDFSAAELQAQLDELSDLSSLDSELADPQAQDAGTDSGALRLVAADTGAQDVGLDEPLSLDMAFDSEDTDTGVLEELNLDSESASGDDVGTKLDLARAYVEMGDQDGARSILEEVVVEGNELQRDDAEKMLAQLG